MKMGVGTRIIFTIFMLVILCVFGLLAAAVFGLISSDAVSTAVNYILYGELRYVWAGIAIVIAILAVALMFFGIKKKAPDTVTLIAGEKGSVHITIDAMEELARRFLAEIQGIEVNRISIRTIGPASVRVNIAVSVMKDVVIPEVTNNITEGMKYHLEKYAGIDAGFVAIKVLPQKQKPQK